MIIPAAPEKLVAMSDDEVVAAYEALGFEHETAVAYTDMLRHDEPVEKAAPELPTEAFLSIESARELAESVGHTELLAEVEKSERSNVGFIKLSESADGDVIVSAPTGVMVALMLDRTYPELKVQGGVTDPHITLCYIGKTEELSLAQTRTLIAVTAEVAARHPSLRGVIKGTGYFEEEGAWFAVPHIPGLDTLRADLADSLKQAGIPVHEDYEFTPHVTLAYTAERPSVDVAPFEVYVTSLTVAVGGLRYDTEFKRADTDNEIRENLVAWEDQVSTPFIPIVKSVEEKRYTLAPMYIPSQYDAHGDWAEPDDLQKALWDFQRGDKLIALQHHPEAGPMGEAVEMMVVPFEHTWPMQKADGSTVDVTFPANTPWLGVIWNEDVWPLVKAGKVRGYSIGGRASLLNVDLPEAE